MMTITDAHANAIRHSVLGIYQVQWNTTPGASPSKSGVYLTKNDKNQSRFKYFDAHWGQWYMGHGELKDSALAAARLSAADLVSHVVAWAHRTRTV